MDYGEEPFIVLFSIIILSFQTFYFIRRASKFNTFPVLQQLLQGFLGITILLHIGYQMIILKNIYANKINLFNLHGSYEHKIVQFICDNIATTLSFLCLNVIFNILKPIDGILNTSGFYKRISIYAYSILRLIPLMLFSFKGKSNGEVSEFNSMLLETFLAGESLLLLSIHINMILKISKIKSKLETLYLTERFAIESTLETLRIIIYGFTAAYSAEVIYRIGFLIIYVSDYSDSLLIGKDLCNILKLGHIIVQFFSMIELLFSEHFYHSESSPSKKDKAVDFFNFNLESEKSENLQCETFVEVVEEH